MRISDDVKTKPALLVALMNIGLPIYPKDMKMKMKMDIVMMTWLKIDGTHECRGYCLPLDITIKQFPPSKDAFQKEYSM